MVVLDRRKIFYQKHTPKFIELSSQCKERKTTGYGYTYTTDLYPKPLRTHNHPQPDTAM